MPECKGLVIRINTLDNYFREQCPYCGWEQVIPNQRHYQMDIPFKNRRNDGTPDAERL